MPGLPPKFLLGYAPLMSLRDTESRMLQATRAFLAERGNEKPDDVSVNLDDAVCQDLWIFGIDVDDYVWALEHEFGDVVQTIPWLHFTDQTGSRRGCSACVSLPFVLPWMLIKRIIWGAKSLHPNDPREHPHRLTLRQIAAAIDAGGWSKDWQPE